MKPVNLKVERIRQIATLSVIVLSYVPFLLFAKLPSNNSDSIIAYFASLLGYLAATMLLWQFVLSTRSVSKILKIDRAWALSIHRKIGISAIVVVLAHPLLITLKYSEGLQLLFIGGLETDFDRHVAMGRIALFLFLIIWVTSALLRAKIGYRPWKYIHFATYLIMILILFHSPGVGSFYAGDEAFRIAWKVMIAVFIIIVALRLSRFFTYGQYQYKLIFKKEISPDVFLYKLSPLKKSVVSNPGQYMYVRSGFWGEEHPFSIANYNEKSGEISIASKVVGKYTEKLSQLENGAIVYLDGPYGVFTRQVEVDTSRPVTFIAGGIGITPFIQHILTHNRNDMTLFNANRSQQQIFLRETLAKKLGASYIDVLSRDSKTVGVEKGYVTADLIKKYLGESFKNQQFFICGPPAMMTEVKKSLIEAGIRPEHVHTEEFAF